jgi:hypothetical protein
VIIDDDFRYSGVTQFPFGCFDRGCREVFSSVMKRGASKLRWEVAGGGGGGANIFIKKTV